VCGCAASIPLFRLELFHLDHLDVFMLSNKAVMPAQERSLWSRSRSRSRNVPFPLRIIALWNGVPSSPFPTVPTNVLHAGYATLRLPRQPACPALPCTAAGPTSVVKRNILAGPRISCTEAFSPSRERGSQMSS
jgi:hypothetical protein